MRCSRGRGRRTLALVVAALVVFLGTHSRPSSLLAQQPGSAAARPIATSTALPPRLTAHAAVVLDADTGAVLYDRNAYQPLPPASLTKILTALVTLQLVDPRQRVTARFDPDELDPDGTVMGLLPGDEVSVEDLLYGLMLSSGNDAALVLARVVGGSEANFAAMMNRAAAANGLRSTTFINAHGLDAPGHRTSAHDIAQITRLAMRDPRFRRIVAGRSWTVTGTRTYTLTNRNPFLAAYPGADGVKTGWTEEAGATIVASAMRNGHRVIVALMDTGDRLGESTDLMDWVFSTFRWTTPPVAGAPPND